MRSLFANHATRPPHSGVGTRRPVSSIDQDALETSMTGRELLSRRGRLVWTVSLLAALGLFGLIPAVIGLSSRETLARYLKPMLAGCVLLPVLAKLWALSLVRCPWCQGQLSRLIDYRFRL